MTRKFRTPYNHVEIARPGENFTLPSLTVPDQTLSIPEILKRYSRGLSLGAAVNTPIYDGEEDLFEGRDPRSLDLTEVAEIMERGKEAGQQIELKQRQSNRRKEYEQLKAEFRDDEEDNKDAATPNPSRENSPAGEAKNEGGQQ